MRTRTVVISGGGTGGHLYPALAVGTKLVERHPDLRLIYVGSRRSVERTIMRNRGVPFVALPVEGLKGRGLGTLKSLALLPWAMVLALGLLLRTRPGLVIGVGGYSSGPVVFASWAVRIPSLILEQNARPGFTNRLLRPFARKAVLAFPSALAYFGSKGIVLGNPVRDEFYRIEPRRRQRTFTLLIFGGSQGSRVLNKAVVDALPLLAADRDRLDLRHQTGSADRDWVKQAYVRAGFERADVTPFIEDMAAAMDKADLCLCRAGATTIAELIAARRPAVLVPFAQATDNHQLLNARELERLGAAEVITESELGPDLLAERLRSFMSDRSRAELLAARLGPLRTERAADRIVDLGLSMMKEGGRA